MGGGIIIKKNVPHRQQLEERGCVRGVKSAVESASRLHGHKLVVRSTQRDLFWVNPAKKRWVGAGMEAIFNYCAAQSKVLDNHVHVYMIDFLGL